MAFWKKDKKEKETKKPSQIPAEFTKVGAVDAKEQPTVAGSTVLPKEYGALKGFYVSEKATSLNSSNQYMFKVFDNATKNEIKKQTEKSFSVKVKGVKIINLPRKSRTVGRHKGFRHGVKKAIVVLEKGYSIEQAKA